MHRHVVFGRACIPEPLEHHRCACTAAGGIDDQIGGQLRHPIAAALSRENAGDAIALRSGGHVDEIRASSIAMLGMARSRRRMWYSRNGRVVLYALIFCELPERTPR